ncbi:gibberellin-regulated protein 8 isoform X1 [Capsella rubella]|uniref:gibberellin-regulated protein 8 isoform X1 n=1 Tax=Capsella rubella TaxID=81985 RepID=UPI000CD543FF|nr:gibberellin-regulated protein 8 isoform X1 [Capsella rubella]
MKLMVAQFFMISLLLTSSLFVHSNAGSAACDGKCNVRCAKADRTHGECLKDCNICCEKCNCVPSGTFGNKDECPCYRDLINSKGGSKCP